MNRTVRVAIAAVLLSFGPAPLSAQAPKTAPATHVTKEQIQEFIAKLPRGRISDNPIRAVDVGGYRVGVFAVVRPKDSPQDAIYHDTNMTEILYILEGSATLVTGGTIPDARPPARPGGNYTGTRIDGGTSRHVGSGRRDHHAGANAALVGEHRERHVGIWSSGLIRTGRCR